MKKKRKKKKKRHLTCQMNGLRTAMIDRPPIGDNAILSEIIWLIIGRRRRVGPKAAAEGHYPESAAPRKLLSCLPCSWTPIPAVRNTYCVTGTSSCQRTMGPLLVAIDAFLSVVLVPPMVSDLYWQDPGTHVSKVEKKESSQSSVRSFAKFNKKGNKVGNVKERR
ncbi:hypothetical protein N7535_005710 [Penicillium sp. DV-2018c]|nr:hypothetical protein N7461_009285 [Penicillium sp. DV-2018c]KAJ5572050.1 hypothetical protein N7535_005710 [Penicillium sp. DV-2018c]